MLGIAVTVGGVVLARNVAKRGTITRAWASFRERDDHESAGQTIDAQKDPQTGTYKLAPARRGRR